MKQLDEPTEKSITPAGTSHSAFQVFDALDDEAIVAEIEGRPIETWCYAAEGGLRLSKKGVDQCILELERQGWFYEEETLQCQQDPTNPEFVLFSAKVKKFRITQDGKRIECGTTIGTKRQSVLMKKRDGTLEEDPFWYEKGAMKAIRNAKLRTIPSELEQKIISLAKAQGRVRSIEAQELPRPPMQNALKRIKLKELKEFLDATFGAENARLIHDQASAWGLDWATIAQQAKENNLTYEEVVELVKKGSAQAP